MDYYDVKRLALIESVKATIEGMKAENAARLYDNQPPKYLFDDFENKAAELQNLAYMHNDQM
jgi:hypothetical protein